MWLSGGVGNFVLGGVPWGRLVNEIKWVGGFDELGVAMLNGARAWN